MDYIVESADIALVKRASSLVHLCKNASNVYRYVVNNLC